MVSALVTLMIAMASNALAIIPVGTKMTYRMLSESGSPGKCEYKSQIVLKEILSSDTHAKNYLVHLKYVNETDGTVTLDTNISVNDETRKHWGIYSTEEIQYMVDHCEELGGRLPQGPTSLYACDLRSETDSRQTSWLIMPGIPFGTLSRSVKAKASEKDCYSLLIVSDSHLK